jgi:hypothetical protein
MSVSERLQFGMVGVNDWYPVTAEAPFGGIKQSGLGRESGLEGVHEYVEARTRYFGGLAMSETRASACSLEGPRRARAAPTASPTPPPSANTPTSACTSRGRELGRAPGHPRGRPGSRGGDVAGAPRLRADLYEEMVAMAEAAGISPAEAVIVGGFTDFVDAVRARGRRRACPEDDCTAVLVPPTRGDGAATWPRPGTCTTARPKHVVSCSTLAPDEAPALVFTTVGCLAQIGMNAARHRRRHQQPHRGTDGRVGVTWPFVVRRMLRQRHSRRPRAASLDAPLAGGARLPDARRAGRGYNVEAMPTHAAVTWLQGDPAGAHQPRASTPKPGGGRPRARRPCSRAPTSGWPARSRARARACSGSTRWPSSPATR